VLVCLGGFFILQDLDATKHNRSLVARTQVKLSSKLGGISSDLVILGTLQLIAICVLVAGFRKTTEEVEPEEVSEALEDSSVSRIIRKRDGLSQQDVLALMKNQAHELQECRKILAYVVERGTDVVCAIDSQGKLASISRASLTQWGYTPQELEGRPATCLIEDRQIKALSARAQTGERAVLETQLQSRDGEQLQVVWTAYWSPAEESLFCIVEDVTLRKRAEEQLRCLLNALPAGVLVTSNEPDLIEFANIQACSLLRSSAQQLQGCSLERVWQEELPAAQAEVGMPITRATASRPDGSKFPIEFSMRSLEFDGEIKKLVVFLDVTAKLEVEKLKQEVLAMITHDLRSPLAAVKGMVVLLDKGLLGTLNEKGQALTAKVSRDFDRLTRLIDDMLDLEKLSAGKLQLDCASLPVCELIDQAGAVVSLHAQAKNIKLVTEDPAAASCWGDRDQLVRVLVNLLSNALKYSPEGGSFVTRAEQFETHVRFAVIDQGRGIPEAKLGRIFEKFEQAELADAKKLGGTGLGLAICQAIVQEHGGQIGALNNPDRGSTFWFTIPRNPGADKEKDLKKE
jgi:PAS domain S-box-containing protein